jgi:hypothetical protein
MITEGEGVMKIDPGDMMLKDTGRVRREKARKRTSWYRGLVTIGVGIDWRREE